MTPIRQCHQLLVCADLSLGHFRADIRWGEEICPKGIFPQADAGVSDFALGPFSLRVTWGYRIWGFPIFGKGHIGLPIFRIPDSGFSVSGRRGAQIP